MLLRAARSGMSVGGYYRDTADAVGRCLAQIVDFACAGLVPGDPAYDDVISGAAVGVALGSGGSRSYAR